MPIVNTADKLYVGPDPVETVYWQGNIVWSAGSFIRLTGRTVAENAANGFTIGTLSIGGTFTGTPVYSLTDSAGGKFAISGANLNKAAALDYETATSHSVTVHVTGLTPPATDRSFTILVTDVDDTAPTITSSSTVSNAENSTLAHSLTADETVTWSIVGGADLARFELSGSTLRWLSNGTKDFETPNDADTNNAYIVQVRATDLASNVTNQTITVTVTDVAGIAPAAPVLLLTSGTGDNTPDFALTGDLALADTVRFQYSTSAVFSGASETTNTIDAGEDAANVLNFSTGSLANGTWYFRARIERPGVEAAISAWSNTETITISVASPYTGPGDVITTGWVGWWGLRAFNSAKRGTRCCRITKTVGGAQTDINSDATTGIVDIAAINAHLAGGAGTFEIIYDQVGSNDCFYNHAGGSPVPIVLGTFGSSPAAMGRGNLPGTGVASNYVKPFTFVGVGQHHAGDSNGKVFNIGGFEFGFANAANTAYAYDGSSFSAVAADDARHAVLCLFSLPDNILNVDNGTDTTSASPNYFDISIGEAPQLAGDNNLTHSFEAGFNSTGLNSTQRGNLSVNMKTYYSIT